MGAIWNKFRGITSSIRGSRQLDQSKSAEPDNMGVAFNAKDRATQSKIGAIGARSRMTTSMTNFGLKVVGAGYEYNRQQESVKDEHFKQEQLRQNQIAANYLQKSSDHLKQNLIRMDGTSEPTDINSLAAGYDSYTKGLLDSLKSSGIDKEKLEHYREAITSNNNTFALKSANKAQQINVNNQIDDKANSFPALFESSINMHLAASKDDDKAKMQSIQTNMQSQVNDLTHLAYLSNSKAQKDKALNMANNAQTVLSSGLDIHKAENEYSSQYDDSELGYNYDALTDSKTTRNHIDAEWSRTPGTTLADGIGKALTGNKNQFGQYLLMGNKIEQTRANMASGNMWDKLDNLDHGSNIDKYIAKKTRDDLNNGNGDAVALATSPPNGLLAEAKQKADSEQAAGDPNQYTARRDYDLMRQEWANQRGMGTKIFSNFGANNKVAMHTANAELYDRDNSGQPIGIKNNFSGSSYIEQLNKNKDGSNYVMGDSPTSKGARFSNLLPSGDTNDAMRVAAATSFDLQSQRDTDKLAKAAELYNKDDSLGFHFYSHEHAQNKNELIANVLKPNEDKFNIKGMMARTGSTEEETLNAMANFVVVNSLSSKKTLQEGLMDTAKEMDDMKRQDPGFSGTSPSGVNFYVDPHLMQSRYGSLLDKNSLPQFSDELASVEKEKYLSTYQSKRTATLNDENQLSRIDQPAVDAKFKGAFVSIHGGNTVMAYSDGTYSTPLTKSEMDLVIQRTTKKVREAKELQASRIRTGIELFKYSRMLPL